MVDIQNINGQIVDIKQHIVHIWHQDMVDEGETCLRIIVRVPPFETSYANTICSYSM